MTALAPRTHDVSFLRAPRRRDLVHVLEADPELAGTLDPSEHELAAKAAYAAVFHHQRGPWSFAPAHDPGSLGVLVLDGLILIRTEVGGRANLELLGPGDVISPWVGVGSDVALPTLVSSYVVEDLQLALLDRRFALRAARWPEIAGGLTHRLITRARRLSLQAAINGIPRIQERLELTLWLLAQRFGRVTGAGVKLRLALTHLQLAEMIAAQRPSVTVALSHLEAGGRVVRLAKHELLLCGPEPEAFRALVQETGMHP